VLLKLDYERTFDNVNWDFLIEVLKARGFGDGIRHCYANGYKGIITLMKRVYEKELLKINIMVEKHL
jgi:hypothetical protein